MEISEPAPAGVWGLLRETDSGTAGIVFSYDSTTPTAYLRYITEEGGQTVQHNVKLLTPADIPSSSGVVSINGLSGVVVLDGSNITYKTGSNTSIADMIDNNAQNIGIPENGNTAAHNISAGQYVIWNGSLYTANSAIAVGDTLNNTNLSAVNGGGLNALNDHIGNLNYKIIENVIFTFSNSNTASKALSDIDSTLANAKYISGFVPNGATTVEITRNMAKTNIHVTIGSVTTGDVSFNILCIW